MVKSIERDTTEIRLGIEAVVITGVALGVRLEGNTLMLRRE
jgi:hypothetical protein